MSDVALTERPPPEDRFLVVKTCLALAKAAVRNNDIPVAEHWMERAVRLLAKETA